MPPTVYTLYIHPQHDMLDMCHTFVVQGNYLKPK